MALTAKRRLETWSDLAISILRIGSKRMGEIKLMSLMHC